MPFQIFGAFKRHVISQTEQTGTVFQESYYLHIKKYTQAVSSHVSQTPAKRQVFTIAGF